MTHPTAADGLYRRNPARDVEQFAISVVRGWIGSRGAVVDLSAGDDPDFRIDYGDGRTAIGEVGWHVDPVVQAMWANTFKHEKHQVIDLTPGQGTWSVHLLPGASIKRLYADLSAFVAHLLAAACYDLTIYEWWPRSDIATEGRRLGIDHIHRYESADADQAIYFMPGSGGVVPEDPNVIAEWIEGVLADPAYADTTGKLLALEADERHVFLMSGSATPFGVDERLRRVDLSLPTRPLKVLNEISHVWVASQYGTAGTVLWGASGWTTVPSPLAP